MLEAFYAIAKPDTQMDVTMNEDSGRHDGHVRLRGIANGIRTLAQQVV